MANKITTKTIRKSIGVSLNPIEHRRLWNHVNSLEDNNLSKWVNSIITKELDRLAK